MTESDQNINWRELIGRLGNLDDTIQAGFAYYENDVLSHSPRYDQEIDNATDYDEIVDAALEVENNMMALLYAYGEVRNPTYLNSPNLHADFTAVWAMAGVRKSKIDAKLITLFAEIDDARAAWLAAGQSIPENIPPGAMVRQRKLALFDIHMAYYLKLHAANVRRHALSHFYEQLATVDIYGELFEGRRKWPEFEPVRQNVTVKLPKSRYNHYAKEQNVAEFKVTVSHKPLENIMKQERPRRVDEYMILVAGSERFERFAADITEMGDLLKQYGAELDGEADTCRQRLRGDIQQFANTVIDSFAHASKSIYPFLDRVPEDQLEAYAGSLEFARAAFKHYRDKLRDIPELRFDKLLPLIHIGEVTLGIEIQHIREIDVIMIRQALSAHPGVPDGASEWLPEDHQPRPWPFYDRRELAAQRPKVLALIERLREMVLDEMLFADSDTK